MAKDPLEDEVKQWLSKSIGKINKVINPSTKEDSDVEKEVKKWLKKNIDKIQNEFTNKNMTGEYVYEGMQDLQNNIKDILKTGNLSPDIINMLKNQLSKLTNLLQSYRETKKREPEKCKDTLTGINKASVNKALTSISSTLKSISGFFTPKDKEKLVITQTFIYKSLIHPSSKDIENVIMNIFTSGYGIKDRMNSVDDLFLRLKMAASPELGSLNKETDTYTKKEEYKRVQPAEKSPYT